VNQGSEMTGKFDVQSSVLRRSTYIGHEWY